MAGEGRMTELLKDADGPEPRAAGSAGLSDCRMDEGVIVEVKVCTSCGESKPLDSYRWMRTKSRHLAMCRPCERERCLNRWRERCAGKKAKGGDATYKWPRSALERAADAALNGFRVVRPVGAVFAPELGLRP